MSQTNASFDDFRNGLEVRQILADIDRKLADRDRKRQEIRFAPIVLMISGMTAGGALFAVGAAFWKVFH